MIRSADKLILLLLAAMLLMPACRTSQGTGAGVGALAGAGLGAVVDHNNRGRGALIGGAAGALVGYAVGDIIEKEKQATARDAYDQRRVIVREVSDQDTGETYRVRAAPTGTATRVTTTVSKWNPYTGQWEQVSESTQDVE